MCRGNQSCHEDRGITTRRPIVGRAWRNSRRSILATRVSHPTGLMALRMPEVPGATLIASAVPLHFRVLHPIIRERRGFADFNHLPAVRATLARLRRHRGDPVRMAERESSNIGGHTDRVETKTNARQSQD